MLDGVLLAVSRCPEVNGLLVVTNSQEVAESARIRNVAIVSDPPGNPALATVVDAGLRSAESRGAERAIVLMADLPIVRPADISAIAHALESHDLVLVPDARGENTNALALRLRDRQPTAFGSPRSFEQHVSRARQAHQSWLVHNAASIAFDVDTPDDYRQLLRRHPGYL
jgi:2-phospho-L-lactate guanylyltransferase